MLILFQQQIALKICIRTWICNFSDDVCGTETKRYPVLLFLDPSINYLPNNFKSSKVWVQRNFLFSGGSTNEPGQVFCFSRNLDIFSAQRKIFIEKTCICFQKFDTSPSFFFFPPDSVYGQLWQVITILHLPTDRPTPL